MKNALVSFLVGLIFSVGLGISGMTNPEKVMGFLDLFGYFDPSLIFVMIGAIFTHFIFYKLIRKRASPILSSEWHVPQKKEISPSLIIGSFLFGIGWAIAGYCPGPALVNLSQLKLPSILFVCSMALGMLIFKILDRKFKFKR